MKPSLVPERLGSGYRSGDVCFCKTLILYAVDEFIIDKKRDIPFGVCRHNYWHFILFSLLCKSLCMYN